jgi:hypothetical protein
MVLFSNADIIIIMNARESMCSLCTWKIEKDMHNTIKMNKLWWVGVGGTGSVSCPVTGFGISGVEFSGSDTAV